MTIPEQDRQRLAVAEVAAGLPGDFRHVSGQVMARYRTPDFAAAQRLAVTIGDLAEADNHHPDLLVGWGYVEVRLSSHDVGAITRRDLRLATRIAAAAKEAGAEPEPAALQVVDWGLDTWAMADVAPFWRAILGYGRRADDGSGEGSAEGPGESSGDDELTDPDARGGPTVWFQPTSQHGTPRQRFHPDIWVPVDEARRRVDAALEAGGVLVSDAEAPSFWVLADRQGNRACICTVQGRSG